MARHELTADQAFQVPARMSTATDREPRTTAEELVLTGEHPAG